MLTLRQIIVSELNSITAYPVNYLKTNLVITFIIFLPIMNLVWLFQSPDCVDFSVFLSYTHVIDFPNRSKRMRFVEVIFIIFYHACSRLWWQYSKICWAEHVTVLYQNVLLNPYFTPKEQIILAQYFHSFPTITRLFPNGLKTLTIAFCFQVLSPQEPLKIGDVLEHLTPLFWSHSSLSSCPVSLLRNCKLCKDRWMCS